MNSPAFNIAEEIRIGGPMSFARFMALALYSPGCGYYERPLEIGRSGDFFTSVSVGPVFGELLAFQFAERLERISPRASGPLQIIEAGAHDGQLALDILHWLRHNRPHLLAAIEYTLIEPSPLRRSWQEEKLGAAFTNVKWITDICELGARSVHGVIFANELLDAMPVHRLCWDTPSREWLEWRVGFNGKNFAWQKSPPTPDLAARLPLVPRDLGAVLPDEFSIEVSPAAIQWWQIAADSLESGALLTLDYGFDEWLQPERPHGTLRAYRNHHISSDILEHPGHQDITAHVNFPSVRAAGEKSGLATELYARQSKFLTDIFIRAQTAGAGTKSWTQHQFRQFQTLTHPEHLGHRFRALLQSR